jgi:hypothetical protein
MPWRVQRSDRCPTSRPWAVINQRTGAVQGCHASQAAARQQMAALYASEPSASRSGHMQSKTLERVEIKDADRGEVSAVFATFNVIDADGDVTLPGAFEEGAEVLISSYGHGSWAGALPVGKGAIRTTAAEAVMDGRFFMDTQAGRDTFKVIKQLGPRQQWSYGYDPLDAEPGTFDGQDVRFLKRQLVHEVSPVMVGSGLNTRTLSAKAAKDALSQIAAQRGSSGYKTAIRPHETATTDRPWDAAAVERGIAADASVSDLRSVYAWVDPQGDPEAKSSYRFPHHQGVGGAANLRACIAGVAVVNGARGGTTIPETDRRGVFNHLAAHMDDGDMERPEMRSGSGIIKQNDELAMVLADLAAVRERVTTTRLSRARKGRALGATTVLLLGWTYDELRALKSLLDSPQEDAAREYVRYLRTQIRTDPGA